MSQCLSRLLSRGKKTDKVAELVDVLYLIPDAFVLMVAHEIAQDRHISVVQVFYELDVMGSWYGG
jgi:hypothetical protein